MNISSVITCLYVVLQSNKNTTELFFTETACSIVCISVPLGTKKENWDLAINMAANNICCHSDLIHITMLLIYHRIIIACVGKYKNVKCQFLTHWFTLYAITYIYSIFCTVVGFTLAYYSIQYCILLLKVKCTLWGLLFLSRIKTADIKEKRVIYIIFLLNQYTKKVILLQNRPSVNRKNRKEEDLRYDIL